MTLADRYDPADIEPRWQQQWEADGLYHSDVDWERPKHYALTMLPYPSGDLHIGHWFAMTPSDAHARFMRMKGFNVLFPMGFDAFGLPAENAAVKRGIHPAKWTYANMDRMRGQLRSMGAMFDWRREIVSCAPEYYHWTEWLFREFYRHELAYRGEATVNWSPTLQTVLANEQVIDGKDERTGQPVIQQKMTQWFFAITKYVDELLRFEPLDWPDSVIKKQIEWIGRSEGAHVTFTVDSPAQQPVVVFTTRPDTLWGATFMVLAPEHELVQEITTDAQQEAVEQYVAAAARLSELERKTEDREKTGVDTGAVAINPVNGEKIPIWIADYVLAGYGSGAIMAVPAHDERDFAFARQFGLRVQPVIQPDDQPPLDGEAMEEAWTGPGKMANSGDFDGTQATDAKGRANPAISAVIDFLQEKGVGEEAVTYRLRDWLISRQRYWGCPIPIVHKADGSIEETPDDQLPVTLPEDSEFDPSGRSPLKTDEAFQATVDSAGAPAKRETDTMDTFMCSSWYQLRYLSPHFDGGPFDPEEAAYWLPVDVYTGGEEHATMHLLYTRFFTKALRDMGVFAPTEAAMQAHGRDPQGAFDEPMTTLRCQGQILGEVRRGHHVLCTGDQVGEVLRARRVEVIGRAGDADVATPDGFAGVAGELMDRKETTLHVGDAGHIVEVMPDAEIVIPELDSARVEQLEHHLEIQRMSKSKGNVVNPDELVGKFGADTVRGYIMFAFDWRKGGPWDSQNILGVQRFLNDVWRLFGAAPDGAGSASEAEQTDLRRKTHQAIERVTQSVEGFSFNTAIAGQMELKNAMQKARGTCFGTAAWTEASRALLRLMAPFTPHIAEELWQHVAPGEGSVHTQPWPEFDPEVAAEDSITLVVQIKGKVRAKIEVPADITEDAAREAALAEENVQKHIEGKEIRKVIFVPGKLLNIVV